MNEYANAAARFADDLGAHGIVGAPGVGSSGSGASV